MKIVISALHFAWSDIECACRHVRKTLGLDGIELSLSPSCDLSELHRIRSAAEREGLLLTNHVWENIPALAPLEASAALERWLDACAAAGIRGVVLHGGSHPDRHEGIGRLIAALEPALPAYEKAGVTLYVENHYGYDYKNCQELLSETWEFREVSEALPSPALGFCFDTGHGHMTRNSAALVREVAPRLGCVHLADNGGIDDDHRPYRQGTVEWDGVFEVLREVRFDGIFCVEFPVLEDTGPFEGCVGDLRRLFGEGRRAGRPAGSGGEGE